MKAQIIELRLAGWPFTVCGHELGVSSTRAFELYNEAMAERVVPGVTEIRREMLEQIDAMMTGIWDAAVNGDVNALNAVLALQQRKAKLTGADMPTEVRTRNEHTGSMDMNVSGQIDHVIQAPLRIVFVKPDGKEIEGSLVPPKLTNGNGSGNGHG